MTASRRVLAVLVVGAALAGAGCPRLAVHPRLQGLTDEQATARVLGAAALRERMNGVVKAKLPGLQGVVMSATLDVAVEPRARLSVAVRSFFEQPMQMLVTDGSVVTIYDASQGAPVFLQGPVTAKAVAKVLPVPLTPEEVVQVFLARPPGTGVPAGDPGRARGRLVGVDERAGTYTVWLEAPGSAPVEITARADDDAIVRWRHFKRDGRPLLDVTYGDFRPVPARGDAAAGLAPHAWTLTLVDREPNESLLFNATDVSFNAAALPDEAFRLDPPPGVSVRPL